MAIGTGIVLLVIGAILTFAINVDVSWGDLARSGDARSAVGGMW